MASPRPTLPLVISFGPPQIITSAQHGRRTQTVDSFLAGLHDRHVLITAEPTGGFYLVIDDVDAHAERARAAGAQIVIEPRDRAHGGRDYTCRDHEGHAWTFGTYDPWATTGA